MFTKQGSPVQQKEIKRFYTLQKEYIQEKNLTTRRNEYLNKDYFQHLVVQYQKHKKENVSISENDFWAFGKALDILIRKNITHKSFIRYNEETKQDFYSNAMYRCLNFAVYSFKESKSAFNYFTSTVRNAFKEELNKQTAQRKIAKQQYETQGVDSIMYNVDNKSLEEIQQEYIKMDNIQNTTISLAYFKQLVIEKYSPEYKIRTISILEDDTVNRFQRKYFNYDLFIPVTTETIVVKDKPFTIDKGLIVDYIDLNYVNENLGQYKTELQKKILAARQNGHQCFFIFSDVWNDKTIDDKLIFEKIDKILKCIKNNDTYNTGRDLMLDYIPYNLIKTLGVTEPRWWLLDEKLDSRHLVKSQDVQEYINYKNISHKYTRVWDAGILNR